MTRVVIAFGANLGDRAATIRAASEAIATIASNELMGMSSLYASAALKLDGIDESAPEYLNAVGLYETDLQPEELLTELARIEHDFGRIRHERWGDRTLDLDIIWMENISLHTDRLTLPHPRAAERSFVVIPWLEVDPHAQLSGMNLAQLAPSLEGELRIFSESSQVSS